MNIVRRAPEAFVQPSTILTPDVPDGVTLDGNVRHVEALRPTLQKKYRG